LGENNVLQAFLDILFAAINFSAFSSMSRVELSMMIGQGIGWWEAGSLIIFSVIATPPMWLVCK
jgi:hypothetical protein